MTKEKELNDRIDESLSIIAPRLGRDMPYFIPLDQLHFDPITVGITLASILLAAYLRGFLKQAEDQAENAGSETILWLRKRIRQLFSRQEASTKNDALELTTIVVEVATKAAEMPETQTAHAHDAMQRRLENELQVTWGIPPGRASKITIIVRDQAIRLIRYEEK
jgi:hypothetical protein